MNGQEGNGHRVNGHDVNGHGANGRGLNGQQLNGHQLNGAPPRPDGYLDDWFQEQGDRYPVQGGHAILGLNPPPGRRPGRRLRIRNGMLVGLGCLIVIVGIGTGLTGAKLPSRSRVAASSTGARASLSAAARPTATGAAGSGSGRILTYRVTGTPGAAVAYGPPGSTLTGRGPMHVTRTLGSAQYYSITARLPHSGSVTCEILIGSTVISKSVAAGRHSLASCEISRDPLSGAWRDSAGG